MTELKTLKDLIFPKGNKEGSVHSSDLRKETIKWIKEEIEIWKANHTLSKKEKVTDVPRIKRWMNRFNLTRKDLK